MRDALEDKASTHGGLASYPTMLFVAQLLAVWADVLTAPPNEPR